VLCFYSKQVFGPRAAKSQPISIKFLNTFVGRLRPRLARGRLQTKPKRLCFCNTWNAP